MLFSENELQIYTGIYTMHVIHMLLNVASQPATSFITLLENNVR